MLAQILGVLLLTTAVALIFTPWQQSVSGNGSVSALTPVERTQSISTPVEGRVLQWHVTEGSKVEKGDLIVEIQDNDPNILTRIQERQLLNNASTIPWPALVLRPVARLTGPGKAIARPVRVQVRWIRSARPNSPSPPPGTDDSPLSTGLRKKTFDRGLSAARYRGGTPEFNTAEAAVLQSEAMLSAAQK